MKKSYKVTLEREDGGKVRISTAELVEILRSDDRLIPEVAISVTGVTEEANDGKTTDEEVYEYLLDKIKTNENGSEVSATWALALERFCNAIRIKAGG